MKKLLSIVCATALVCGCATRPQEGPGSGSGADYVPMVAPSSVESTVYEQDLAKCRANAKNVPFKASQHDDALVAVNIGVISAGTWIGWPTLTAAAVVGGMGGFNYWVYTPERRVWQTKQETVMANCMAQRGYINTDPSVRVTWVPPSQRMVETIRPTGRDTYNVEQLAKAQRCNALPVATLVEKGPGFERHTVACTNGQVMAVRCEFGNCRMSPMAAQRS
ncbi:hypothetical protein J7E62_11510 [Variovorax paradoxus]|nr:hypothetical protein [Variovorax paradoxus]